MGLAIVQPMVPVADGKSIIGSRVIFSRFALSRYLLIGGIVGRAGVDGAGECDGLAIGPPLRRRGASRERRHSNRLAAAHHVHYIDLGLVIAIPLGGESKTAAVRTPLSAALRSFTQGQAARLRTAVSRHNPEIGRLF